MPALERYTEGDFNIISGVTGITYGEGNFWLTKYDDPTFYKYTLAGVADGTVSRSVWGRCAGVTFVDNQLVTVHDGSPGEARAWFRSGGAHDWRFGFESTNTRGRGVCFDDESFYVVDTDTTKNPTSSVYEYEYDGTFVAKYGLPEVAAASGIVPFGGGFLVANQTDAKLHFYTSGFSYIDEYTLDSANNAPNGLAIEGDHIYVVQSGKVYGYELPSSIPEAERVPELDFRINSGNANPRGITFRVDRFWVVGETQGVYSYLLQELPYRISQGRL